MICTSIHIYISIAHTVYNSQVSQHFIYEDAEKYLPKPAMTGEIMTSRGLVLDVTGTNSYQFQDASALHYMLHFFGPTQQTYQRTASIPIFKTKKERQNKQTKK